MTEETFFAALRDHVPRFVLTVSRSDRVQSEQYAVELFARGQSFRCKGFTPQECFESILRTLGIDAAPASATPATAPATRPGVEVK